MSDTTSECHIDLVFESGSNFIRTGDAAPSNRAWVVYFYDGRTVSESVDFNASVRLVRSI